MIYALPGYILRIPDMVDPTTVQRRQLSGRVYHNVN